MSDLVLLTGISGFLGGHVALALLQHGYAVRGSVRSLSKAEKVKATLSRAGADVSRLQVVALDLLDDTGWAEAAAGCRYLQHVASPFVIDLPRDRNELIRPAVEGTSRAVSAALAAGHERLVITSSVAAIAYGHPRSGRTFTAADWTNLDSPRITAYQESKVRAEREAWRLADAAGARERLVSINPGAIMGPLLDDDPGTSGALVLRLLGGSMPGAPKMSFSIVDVRDVAAAQVAAMTDPAAAGQRIILADRELTLLEMADAIRAGLPANAGRLPRFELPDWLVRLVGLFDARIRDNTIELSNRRPVDGSPGRRLLGRPTIGAADATLAMARSLVAAGLTR